MYPGAYVVDRLGTAERSGSVAVDRQRVPRAVVFACTVDNRNTDANGYSDPDTDRNTDARTFGRLYGPGLEPDGGVYGRADCVA